MVSGDETVLNDSDSIADLRRELFTLFRNAARVDWSAAVAFTGSLVDQVLGAQPGACTAGQAEVAITLLYNLGEGAPEAALKHTGCVTIIPGPWT